MNKVEGNKYYIISDLSYSEFFIGSFSNSLDPSGRFPLQFQGVRKLAAL
jgi:hypothetical protein